MRHLDLFSGIGGFALAAQWVWGEQHEIVSFCEIDPFCQRVLKKHWPDVPICEDIRSLTNEWIIAHADNRGSSRELRKEIPEWKNTAVSSAEFCCGSNGGSGLYRQSIDILTGGFPCQPYSVAGNQLGDDDDRALWPEMLRVIREVRPRWVIGENVAGIIKLALDEVCTSLEMEGYEVQPVVIPACAVNAPHRRDRVWIIGNSEGKRNAGAIGTVSEGANTNCDKSNSHACHSLGVGLSGDARRRTGQESEDGYSEGQVAPDADSEHSKEYEPRDKFQQAGRERTFRRCIYESDWDKNWLEVAAELCGVDDGLPAELDGLKLSKSKHREQRLKALGNAIVPQVAQVIMQKIKEADKLALFAEAE